MASEHHEMTMIEVRQIVNIWPLELSFYWGETSFEGFVIHLGPFLGFRVTFGISKT